MAYEISVIEGQKKKLLVDDDSQFISVCAYCRVSTDKRDQRNSLQAQTRFFEKEFAKHPNWIGKKIFYDEGISGTSLKKRDDFNKMIDLAKAGKYQLIITKDVSRFSRNVENTMSIVVDLQKRGVYIIFLSDEINTQRAEDRELLTAAIKQAEGESLKLSNKVRWGQQESMLEGVVFGRKEMYGYNIVRDEDTGKQKFVIIPDEAEIVKRVFHMYANGMGTFKIAKQLDQEGIKTKRYKNGWSNTVILRMLRNEKYVGDLVTGKTYTPDCLDHGKKYNRGESVKVEIRDHHPDEAIIDRKLWDQVQRMLKENEPSDEAKAKHSNRYWCSGKIFCGECGARYVSHKKKMKSGKRTKSWVCWENQQRGREKEIVLGTGEQKRVGCDSHSLNDRVLLQGIYDIIVEYIKPNFQSIQTSVTEVYEQRTKVDAADAQKQIAALTAQVDSKKKTKINLTIDHANRIMDTETYKDAVRVLNEQIVDLLEQINNLTTFDKVTADAIMEYNRNIEQLNAIVSMENDAINEAVFRSILERIEVCNGKILKYYIKFLPNPIILRYATKGRGDNYTVNFEVLTEDTLAELKSSEQ